ARFPVDLSSIPCLLSLVVVVVVVVVVQVGVLSAFPAHFTVTFWQPSTFTSLVPFWTVPVRQAWVSRGARPVCCVLKANTASINPSPLKSLSCRLITGAPAGPKCTDLVTSFLASNVGVETTPTETAVWVRLTVFDLPWLTLIVMSDLTYFAFSAGV